MQFLATANQGDIAILQINHLIGVFYDRTGITTQEELVLADTHYQRALLAGSNNLVRVTLVNHGNRIGTNHLIESHLNSLQQREVLLDHDVFNQLNQHLRIGIADKLNTLGLQFLLDISIVLNDTIMDNSQIMTL